MPPLPILIVVAVVFVAFGVMVFLFGARTSKLTEELNGLETKYQNAIAANRQQRASLTKFEEVNAELDTKYKQVLGHLETADKDNEYYKGELAKRYTLERKIYRILTVGKKATGKTSLTLKWSNPLVDLGTIEGTQMERYQRTVSLVHGPEKLVEHVFQIHDWGGEHIVDAQAELVGGDIHGILLVVDLGGKDARQVDTARIQDQLNEFSPPALKFFFGSQSMTSCKTVVLFINKSDLLSMSPSQAEAQAKAYYAPLIEALNKHSTNLDVKVMVGSTSFGHATHVVFSHFVRQLLPRSAYDPQLLQRVGDATRKRSQTQSTPGPNGVAPAPMLPANGPNYPAPGGAPQIVNAVKPPVPGSAKPLLPVAQLGHHESNGMEQTMPLMNRKPGFSQR